MKVQASIVIGSLSALCIAVVGAGIGAIDGAVEKTLYAIVMSLAVSASMSQFVHMSLGSEINALRHYISSERPVEFRFEEINRLAKLVRLQRESLQHHEKIVKQQNTVVKKIKNKYRKQLSKSGINDPDFNDSEADAEPSSPRGRPNWCSIQ